MFSSLKRPYTSASAASISRRRVKKVLSPNTVISSIGRVSASCSFEAEDPVSLVCAVEKVIPIREEIIPIARKSRLMGKFLNCSTAEYIKQEYGKIVYKPLYFSNYPLSMGLATVIIKTGGRL